MAFQRSINNSNNNARTTSFKEIGPIRGKKGLSSSAENGLPLEQQAAKIDYYNSRKAAADPYR